MSLQTERYCSRVDGYYAKKWDSHDMPMHNHGRIEMMYVVTGLCYIYVATNFPPDNNQNLMVEELKLREGEFVFLDSGVGHRLVIEKENPCYLLNIEFTLNKASPALSSSTIKDLYESSENMRKFTKKELPYIVFEDDSNDIYTTLRMILDELPSKQENMEKDFVVNSLMNLLFIKMARISLSGGDKISGVLYVRKAIKYIHKMFDNEISIDDIGKHVGVHSAYLQRIFKAKTGMSLLEYITGLRMEKARMLLENTALPVVDVAITVGFNSRQHFAHTFKKSFGVSAREYRKNKSSRSKSNLWFGFNGDYDYSNMAILPEIIKSKCIQRDTSAL